MVVRQNSGVTDEFDDGHALLGNVGDEVGGDADSGHLADRVGLMIPIDEKVGFIAIDPNGVIALFRLDPEEFVGDPSAQLRDAKIDTLPFRQKLITDVRCEFLIQKTHRFSPVDSLYSLYLISYKIVEIVLDAPSSLQQSGKGNRMPGPPIIVLGAYGLAGRTIVRGLIERTDHDLIAAGRDPQRLDSLLSAFPESRCRPLVLDASDPEALGKACASIRLVINAIGPYALHGARIARTAIESGASYIDCANEQVHYRRLIDLDPIAREKGHMLVTAAGTIPGLSTILAAKLIETSPPAASVNIAFAQFRHAYEESGLGSIMSGVLDAVHQPAALVDGKEIPVLLGSSFRELELPPPFGRRRTLEVPTIDTLTLPERYNLKDLHTWFYMGEQPAWLFGLIRLLKPHRRNCAYRLIQRVVCSIEAHEYASAVKAGLGTEALLHVEVNVDAVKKTGTLLMRDGAIAMGCVPVIIAKDYLAGRTDQVGLTTPLDFMDFDRLRDEAEDLIRGGEFSG